MVEEEVVVKNGKRGKMQRGGQDKKNRKLGKVRGGGGRKSEEEKGKERKMNKQREWGRMNEKERAGEGGGIVEKKMKKNKKE